MTTNNTRRQVCERAGVDETVPTDEAAVLLGRSPQTLRRWACYSNGPVQPRRVNGRLAWPLAAIKATVGAPAAA